MGYTDIDLAVKCTCQWADCCPWNDCCSCSDYVGAAIDRVDLSERRDAFRKQWVQLLEKRDTDTTYKMYGGTLDYGYDDN